jgi:hypothetical protein
VLPASRRHNPHRTMPRAQGGEVDPPEPRKITPAAVQGLRQQRVACVFKICHRRQGFSGPQEDNTVSLCKITFVLDWLHSLEITRGIYEGPAANPYLSYKQTLKQVVTDSYSNTLFGFTQDRVGMKCTSGRLIFAHVQIKVIFSCSSTSCLRFYYIYHISLVWKSHHVL